MKNKILIHDIETTGFSCRSDSIVEIGAVELDLDNGEIKTVFNSLCREERFIDPFAWIFENSDLTPDDIIHAPRFEFVKEKFQEVINKYPLGATAFNNVFDFRFMEDRGLNFPVKLGCPMLIYASLYKIDGGYKRPTVAEAFRFFFPDINYSEKHRGADDAFHEAMIVYKLFQMGKFQV